MTDAMALALTTRPWMEFQLIEPYFPPFKNWEEYYVWPSVKGKTLSYYKSVGEYGLQEWVIQWDETLRPPTPVHVWRVM